MAKDFFQVISSAYSFSSSQITGGGETYSLPQNDYGVYGEQVDALFDSLSITAEGTYRLAAWFVADAGLSYYSNDPGASAAVLNYLSERFPIDSDTDGFGLIDLRGSADWNQIVGDGIGGPTKASSAAITGTNTNVYIDGIATLFELLESNYPNIKWGIAGLPHIPYYATYAPATGNSPAWDASLTNNGNYSSPYWWDPSHPTGDTNRFYSWAGMPGVLSDFYQGMIDNGAQGQILSQCNVGWICPDVRVPFTDALPFYEYAYDPQANYNRNKKLVENAVRIADAKLVKTYPIISNMYPSREMNMFDDHSGVYGTMTPKTDIAGNSYFDIGGTSYTGHEEKAAESFYPAITFRVDMVGAVVDGGGDGFLFHDAIPSMIDAACTGTVTGGNSLYDAQTRARNMFSFMFHGGAYTDGYEPIGGYTANHVKAEMKRYFSKETMGYLNALRESVNIAPHGIPGASFVPAKNGYVRSAKDPFAQDYTFPIQDSTNTSASDSTYGNQQWGYQFGDSVICPCPDPCIGFEGRPPSQCCCITATKKVWTNGTVCCCILSISMNNRQGNPSEGCECETSRTVTVIVNVSMGSQSCGFGSGCECRSIQISPPSGNCTTATLEVRGGGSYDTDGNETSLACQCGLGPPAGTQEQTAPIDVEGFGCNNTFASTSNTKGSEYYSDVFEDGMATNRLSLIADIQNYKRANNTERFILTRRGSKTDWISIYSEIIQGTTIPLSFQARSTLLNPVVSLNAIKTHVGKDINLYIPGQYFES
jgi:hypothetical protein